MYNNSNSPKMKWRPRLKIYTGGQNNEFNPETFEARSYRWWVYVKKIKGRVIFNNYSYSSTTSSHQYNMRELLKSLKVKYIMISQRQSLSDGILLDEKYRLLFKNELQLKSKGRKASYYKDRQDAIKNLKKDIKELRGLGGKLSNTLKDIKASVKQSEESRLERQRIISTKQREVRKALINEHGKDVLTNTDAISI